MAEATNAPTVPATDAPTVPATDAAPAETAPETASDGFAFGGDAADFLADEPSSDDDAAVDATDASAEAPTDLAPVGDDEGAEGEPAPEGDEDPGEIPPVDAPPPADKPAEPVKPPTPEAAVASQPTAAQIQQQQQE